MQVVILAGGRGTRLGGDQPKPMVKIGELPMLSHIMGIYRSFGHNQFLIATGYKGEVIREYYKDDPKVTCLDTGLDSGTGQRIAICANTIRETFMLTYGDGLADINLYTLQNFHKENTVTVTAIQPAPRFGEMVINGNQRVIAFNEKPERVKEWINGGFFIVSMIWGAMYGGSWESDKLPYIASKGYLRAYKHRGWWACMDTMRDWEYLNQLWQEGKAPWIK
jgi:glucose-1-phosphate cytidylyltransferase